MASPSKKKKSSPQKRSTLKPLAIGLGFVVLSFGAGLMLFNPDTDNLPQAARLKPGAYDYYRVLEEMGSDLPVAGDTPHVPAAAAAAATVSEKAGQVADAVAQLPASIKEKFDTPTEASITPDVSAPQPSADASESDAIAALVASKQPSTPAQSDTNTRMNAQISPPAQTTPSSDRPTAEQAKAEQGKAEKAKAELLAKAEKAKAEKAARLAAEKASVEKARQEKLAHAKQQAEDKKADAAPRRMIVRSYNFDDSKQADALRAQLLMSGFEARSYSHKSPSGKKNFQIEIGPFQNKADAEAARATMMDLGTRGAVLPL